MMTGMRPRAHVEAHLPRQLVAVHAGQMVIGDDEIGQLLVQAVEGGFRGRAPGDVEAVRLQHVAQLQRLGLRILDQEDLGGLASRGLRSFAVSLRQAQDARRDQVEGQAEH